MEEGGCLTGGAVGSIEAGQTMRTARRADHMGGVVEEVGGAGQEAGVVPDGHEEGRLAFLAGRVFFVPA